MKQYTPFLGGAAGLVVASLAGLALFTLVGGLIIVAGVVLATLAVGASVYALVTGKRFFGTGRSPFGEVRIFDIRTGDFQTMRDAPSEREMIDITPPKTGPRKRP